MLATRLAAAAPRHRAGVALQHGQEGVSGDRRAQVVLWHAGVDVGAVRAVEELARVRVLWVACNVVVHHDHDALRVIAAAAQDVVGVASIGLGWPGRTAAAAGQGIPSVSGHSVAATVQQAEGQDGPGHSCQAYLVPVVRPASRAGNDERPVGRQGIAWAATRRRSCDQAGPLRLAGEELGS